MGEQDGGIEECGIHLYKYKKKYIYIWNNMHRLPTEHWQKMSYDQRCKKKLPLKLICQRGKKGNKNWMCIPER